MKRINLIIFLTALFIPIHSYAFPGPPDPCPCNTSITGGMTGSEILAEICPGGELAPNATLILNQEEISVSLENLLRAFRTGFIGFFGKPACELFTGADSLINGINVDELEACRVTIIEACGLRTRPIPTLSEWGLMAMAGVLGLVGMAVIRRKRAK